MNHGWNVWNTAMPTIAATRSISTRMLRMPRAGRGRAEDCACMPAASEAGTPGAVAGTVLGVSAGVSYAIHTILRSAAHRVSSVRFDSWSLRSTALICVSTVLMEMNSSAATSLYV